MTWRQCTLSVLPFLGRRPSSPTPISSVQTKIRRYRAVRSSSESAPPPNRDSASSAPIPVDSVRGNREEHKFLSVVWWEEKLRAICTLCGKIAYQNPKMVVGCLIEHDEKGSRLLKVQSIRETWEEAGAEVEVIWAFAQLDIPCIGQTYIIFLARMQKPHFSPGPESSDCI